MNKLIGVVSALAIAASTSAVAATAHADAPASNSPAVHASAAPDKPKHRMTDRWAREPVRFGDRDAGVYDIEHVRELQYRLNWAGFLSVAPTGRFGYATRVAVRKFQRANDLKANGIVKRKTWEPLLKQTVRHRGAVPKICETDGWHACYDRSMHQVTLWHDGQIHNTWLVRGGAYSTPTRTGNTVVYRRDIDHTSGLFDDAPMPYAQFFDGGQAYHGSAFMIDPFDGHSHGCINMYIEDARQLWKLTSTKKLNVSVYGGWDKMTPSVQSLAKD